jgi:hypothetical protein
VQIHVYEITLHQIGISRRGASQIKMAEIFAAFAQEDAERNVAVLVVTAKRYVLQAIQEFGPAIRIAEVPVVFVIGQLRKAGAGWGQVDCTRVAVSVVSGFRAEAGTPAPSTNKPASRAILARLACRGEQPGILKTKRANRTISSASFPWLPWWFWAA